MTVIAAYSPDDFGRAALEHAAAESRRRGVRLLVVNATRGDALVDRRFAGEEQIEQLRRDLAADGLEVEVRHDVVPDVADAVVDAARSTSAELVVVGVRHRSPVGKVLLGSVAQRVILDAPCPVLAVKPAR